MAVESHRIEVQTRGNSEVVNLTDQIAEVIRSGAIKNGTATVFVIGSTAAVTTTEFEPGLATHDLKAAFEKLAPEHGHYVHESTWHDDNGHSHVRATLVGPSLTIPLIDHRLQLGTWQQVVLIDFDTRSRTRQLIIQVLGE